MPLTAEQISSFVAPYVGMSYPNDRDRVFELLSLVQNKIWESGKFHNSTKWFYVNARNNKTITTPHGYNVLLGCNVNFKPVNINDTYSLFHKNGPSEKPLTDNNFNTTIQFLGDSPVIHQPNQSWCNPCKETEKRRYFITVCGQMCNEKTSTIVSALGEDGRPIYTYYKEETGDTPVICDDKETAPEEIQYHEGVKYPILGQKVFHKHIIVSSIYNIIKEASKVPVEYYLTDRETGVGVLTARLEPHELVSKYKIYQIAGECIKGGKCILGLFKMSKPVDIVSESQIFISDNKDAILCFAQGLNYIHNKEDIDTGNKFMSQALIALRAELREEMPNANSRLQVDSLRNFSRIPNFQ